MPQKTNQKHSRSRFSFSDDLLDQLLEDYEKPGDMFGDDGLLESLKAKLVERALRTRSEPLRTRSDPFTARSRRFTGDKIRSIDSRFRFFRPAIASFQVEFQQIMKIQQI